MPPSNSATQTHSARRRGRGFRMRRRDLFRRTVGTQSLQSQGTSPAECGLGGEKITDHHMPVFVFEFVVGIDRVVPVKLADPVLAVQVAEVQQAYGNLRDLRQQLRRGRGAMKITSVRGAPKRQVPRRQ